MTRRTKGPGGKSRAFGDHTTETGLTETGRRKLPTTAPRGRGDCHAKVYTNY
jgi:hypothetical protein